MQESGLNKDGKDLGRWGGECDGDIYSFIHSFFIHSFLEQGFTDYLLL